ncbi:MAG: hypothetical protein ABIG84_04075 [archaeon]
MLRPPPLLRHQRLPDKRDRRFKDKDRVRAAEWHDIGAAISLTTLILSILYLIFNGIRPRLNALKSLKLDLLDRSFMIYDWRKKKKDPLDYKPQSIMPKIPKNIMAKKRPKIHGIKDAAIKTTKDTLSRIRQKLKKEKPYKIHAIPKNPALKDVKYHLLGYGKEQAKLATKWHDFEEKKRYEPKKSSHSRSKPFYCQIKSLPPQAA